jgi:hypothetical protein
MPINLKLTRIDRCCDLAPAPHDFPIVSITDSNSLIVCLHLAASGAAARRASSTRSIALSTTCHSTAARGFSDASASFPLRLEILDPVFGANKVTLVDQGGDIDDDATEGREVAEPR